MAKISGLCDELLVMILSFLPTKLVVSTSILSKRWEQLWMWVPKLEYEIPLGKSKPPLWDFIGKTLPLHKAPVIESLCLKFCSTSCQLEDVKQWVGTAVSRCMKELSIEYTSFTYKPDVLLPSSLYTCKMLVTLKLKGYFLVDVPRTVSLPSLKTFHLEQVVFLDEESLRLLLLYCPVLENLIIEKDDDVKALVVIAPSLQRLSLKIDLSCSYDRYVIVAPSLKYFKVEDERENFSYLIEYMPKLEEADINIVLDFEKLLESVTSVKRLSLHVLWNSTKESVYRAGIVFNQLEHLKFCIETANWSTLLVRLLKDSPNLRVLNILVDSEAHFEDYEGIKWDNKQSYVPKCLLKDLESFEFAGYRGTREQRDFLSFLFNNARRLKSSSVLS